MSITYLTSACAEIWGHVRLQKHSDKHRIVIRFKLGKELGVISESVEDHLTYLVVVNDEKQYSIWRADRDLPAGWAAEGKKGMRKECLEHIAEIWTDMRPLSVRRALAENA
jgi:MbtH protein